MKVVFIPKFSYFLHHRGRVVKVYRRLFRPFVYQQNCLLVIEGKIILISQIASSFRIASTVPLVVISSAKALAEPFLPLYLRFTVILISCLTSYSHFSIVLFDVLTELPLIASPLLSTFAPLHILLTSSTILPSPDPS